MNILTWREIFEFCNKLTPEQLDMKAIGIIPDDEILGLSELGIGAADDFDFPNRPYMIFK